jgi:hypothetical protein
MTRGMNEDDSIIYNIWIQGLLYNPELCVTHVLIVVYETFD